MMMKMSAVDSDGYWRRAKMMRYYYCERQRDEGYVEARVRRSAMSAMIHMLMPPVRIDDYARCALLRAGESVISARAR